MAIVFDETVAAVAGTTSVVYTYPAAVDANDMLVVVSCNKGFAVDPTSADFVAQASATSGSVASGPGVGSTRGKAFTRVADGSEDGGTTTFTYTGANTAIARMNRWHITGLPQVWSIATTSLADTTETGTTVSASGSAIDIRAGDALVFGETFQSANSSDEDTGPTLTVPGCTLSALLPAGVSRTTNGDDCGVFLARCTVTAGASNGSPITYTATAGFSGRSARAIALVRLREPTPADATLTGTASITAAATVTKPVAATAANTATMAATAASEKPVDAALSLTAGRTAAAVVSDLADATLAVTAGTTSAMEVERMAAATLTITASIIAQAPSPDTDVRIRRPSVLTVGPPFIGEPPP